MKGNMFEQILVVLKLKLQNIALKRNDFSDKKIYIYKFLLTSGVSFLCCVKSVIVPSSSLDIIHNIVSFFLLITRKIL